MAVSSPPRLTYRDLLRLPEDGKRHELIGGEHFVSPSPSTKHQVAVVRLVVRLAAFVERERLGTVLVAPFDVVFTDFDVVEPDLLFVSTERAGILTERNAVGAPDLVVEVLSASTRSLDRTRKRELYGQFGVREYWLLDPDRETAVVDRLTDQGFRRAAMLSAAAGHRLETPLLPGLSFPLAEIFAR